MTEKERKAYEELLRQQEVKQDKIPWRENLKQDLASFGLIVFVIINIVGPIIRSMY